MTTRPHVALLGHAPTRRADNVVMTFDPATLPWHTGTKNVLRMFVDQGRAICVQALSREDLALGVMAVGMACRGIPYRVVS